MNIVVIIFAIVCVAVFAKTLVLPIILALFLAMGVSPLSSKLKKCGIPTSLSALMALSLLICVIAIIVSLTIEPLEKWITKLPEATRIISENIRAFSVSIDDATSLSASTNNTESSVSSSLMNVATTGAFSMVASSTPIIIAHIFVTLVLSYFFLIYGEEILRKTITLRDTFSEKRITIEIARSIQTDISCYLLVISIINLALGFSVFVVFSIVGIKDPVLWGVLAMTLNFAPYLGPMIMSVVLLCLGIVEYDNLWLAVMPFTLYIILNMLEASAVTPIVLGKRLRLNPLVVLIWMFTWGWIWGAAGFLIGVPLLVCFKIIAQRMDFFGNWIQLLEDNQAK